MDVKSYDPLSLEELIDLQDFHFKSSRTITVDREFVSFVDEKDQFCMVRYDACEEKVLVPKIGSKKCFPCVNPSGDILVTRLEDGESQSYPTVIMYNIKTKETIHHGKACYYKWISADTVAVVTQKEVYHWSKDGSSVKVFDLMESMQSAKFENYLIDDTGNWHLLVTRAPGKIMQLHSVKHGRSKQLVGHQAACFTKYKKSGDGTTVGVLCIDINMFPPGVSLDELPEASHEVRIRELDEDFNLPVVSKALVMVYPHANRDVCIGLHGCDKYGVVFHVTARGWITLLHVESGVDFYMSGYDILRGGNTVVGVSDDLGGQGIVRRGNTGSMGSIFKITLNEDKFETYVAQKVAMDRKS